MICSDIRHKYHEWYFKIVIQFWNITSDIYAKYHIQIMLLFDYTTTRKRFVIFRCRYFKSSPLSPKIDQHQFSPHNIDTLSKEKVRRINKMITSGQMLWSFNKFSQLILLRNVWRSVWRICEWISGLPRSMINRGRIGFAVFTCVSL